MIVDSLDNLKFYSSLNPYIDKVVDFINSNNLQDLNCGRHNIDADNVYVSIQEYDTKNETDSKPEFHNKYIDIQLVISGKEKIGYANRSEIKNDYLYDIEKDLAFVDASVDFIEAMPGRFFILFPFDLHQPSISVDEKCFVKKAVFKLKVV